MGLAIAGLTSHDETLVRSAYLAMNFVGWWVIVPFGLAALLTGVVQSLGTAWGLFRHYWVLLKFVLTAIATGLLLLHMNLATRLAEIAAQSRLPAPHMHGRRLQIMADTAAAISLLIVNTALSVYKPEGLTLYGRRKLHEERMSSAAHASELDTASAPRWVKGFSISAFVLIVLFRVVLLHLSGGSGRHDH